jgi:hypothetical protein
MTLDELLAASTDEFTDPLQLVRDSCYRWGSCQAILYDRAREELFPQPYLAELYQRARASGRAKLGILEPLFCGQRDLSLDAITSYLASVPLVVLGEWRDWNPPPAISVERINALDPQIRGIVVAGQMRQASLTSPHFHPLGFCFPALMPNIAAPQHQPSSPNSLFGAYAFFAEAWRSPQQHVLTYLGVSYLFYEFRAAAIHGVRYADNHLTARWMRQFGFRDLSPALPSYLYRYATGELASGVISSCQREDFADLLRQVLLGLRGESAGSAVQR